MTSYVVQRHAGAITVALPIKTVSEANQREHWANRHRRKKAQQAIAVPILQAALRPIPTPPLAITFTRVSVSKMDADNLAGAMKHIQDALCHVLGIDDGDDKLRFAYAQRRTKTRAAACVEVELAGA